MIIGIDVGGTHADGVLLEGTKLVAKHKVIVDQDHLSETVIALLRDLIPEDRRQLERIHLSSTLATNAIVTGNLEPIGMLIQAGPGINPDFLAQNGPTWFLDGVIDHRGHIIRDPDTRLIDEAAAAMRQAGIDSVGIVTKFSYRNSIHERFIADRLGSRFSHICMGHQISGLPNFPRRVYSTWLNASLTQQFHRFKEAIEQGLAHLGIDCPCHILKADGGTIPFARAIEFPCESVHSGPSASVMGCLALAGQPSDSILLDIGGTTTDISLLVDGVPLLEPYGINIAGRPTLIRALNTISVGLGGDSAVGFADREFHIGPRRNGPPMAQGGTTPTPTDAMVVLGLLAVGSAEKAVAAMNSLGTGWDPEETAGRLLATFAERVRQAVAAMIDSVFSRPVYTVSALLHRRRITPERLIVIGGPAAALKQILESCFTLPCTVPTDYEVANAVGAARTQLTAQATLYADTADGRVSIPEISCLEDIPNRFGMAEAETKLEQVIRGIASEMGMTDRPEIDFLERLEMNVIRGFETSGKILNLKAQIRPGLAAVKGVQR